MYGILVHSISDYLQAAAGVFAVYRYGNAAPQPL